MPIDLEPDKISHQRGGAGELLCQDRSEKYDVTVVDEELKRVTHESVMPIILARCSAIALSILAILIRTMSGARPRLPMSRSNSPWRRRGAARKAHEQNVSTA